VVLPTLLPLFLAGGGEEGLAIAKYVSVHDEFHLQGPHQERLDDALKAVDPSVFTAAGLFSRFCPVQDLLRVSAQAPFFSKWEYKSCARLC
jgi:hypothetical protein